MKIFGVDPQKFFNNPINVLMAGVVLFVIWNVYQQYEGFSDEQPSVVMYHLPSCGHCKNMMPEWNKFQKAHEGDAKVNVRNVDCSKSDEGEKHDVHGFPTVIKFKDGKKEVFQGERTAAALEGFLQA